jgi:flagellar hook-associated protein 2
VNITQAATRGTYAGVDIDDPGSSVLVLDSTNNRLKFTIDGIVSNEIVLTAKSYESTDELVRELQQRLDSDTKVGITGVTVSWEETSSGRGHLVLTSSKYGKNSRISIDRSIANGADVALGLAAGVAVNGLDVEGTINGEEATGVGQVLSGNKDNETTDGLKLRISLTADQLADGAEGTITLAKGLGSKMNKMFTGLTQTGDGILDRRIKSYEDQASNLAERVVEFDERLELRRERLLGEFQAMEAALAEMSSVSSYLEAQISGLSANWKSSGSDQQ